MIIAAKAATGGSTLPYQWVAVGASGNLATSTTATATTWTARTSSFGADNINKVRSNGGIYVAVGNNGKLATSPDGITWTQQTSSFSTTAIFSVVYGNGYWVASGGSGKVATSVDAVTWTQRTTGHAANNIYSGYGNGVFVTVNASTGAIYTATDPTGTWTSRTSTLFGTQNEPVWYSTSLNIWSMGTDGNSATGQIQSSTDGITWTSRNLPNATPLITGYGAVVANATVICWNYQTGSSTFDIASSTDGITFTDRSPAVTATGPLSSAVDDAGFMVFGLNTTGTNIQTSSDGITWTGRTGPSFAPIGICHSSARFGG